MRRISMPASFGAALLAVLALGAGTAHAQQRGALPSTQRPVGGDTARSDTTPGRTLPPDTLYERLLKLPGYSPVEYQGDSAEFRGGNRVLRLRGSPQVQRDGTTLTATDSIVYRERTGFVEAYGTPRVTGEGEEISGNVMFYDLTKKSATVQGAKTKVTDGATWLVAGDVTQEQGQRIYATESTFTSDDREEPAYHFKADKIMVVRNRILVGRDAFLYFRNVPVMWLPFIVQDLEKGRRSGILVPRFELNDIVRTSSRRGGQGTGREISNLGYYWAINEYLGAQVSGRWRSESYTALNAEVDYRVRRRFLSGRFAFENFWRDEERSTFTLSTSNSWKPSERTDLSLAANYAKSSDFIRRRSTDPFEVTQNLSSSLSATRRLDWGSLSMSGERQQSLADGGVTQTLPRFTVSVNPITLFPAADDASWYNNATLTTNLGGSYATRRPGAIGTTREGNRDDLGANSGQTLTFGNLSVSASQQFARTVTGPLAALDTADFFVGIPRDSLRAIGGSEVARASWNAGVSYRQPLIASTSISPGLTISQEFLRQDSVANVTIPFEPISSVAGRYVAGPVRPSLTANLVTDLYGFFPGVGPYSAIRHHVKPGVNYQFTPAVEPTLDQRAAFGLQAGRERNELRVDLSQTFEAKLRETRQEPADTSAALAGDTTSAGSSRRAAPADPGKRTILAINTSALAYSFVPLFERGDSIGRFFSTEDISNSIRTDYFGGFNFTVGHDLFAEEQNDVGRTTSRRFSPFLTSFQTQLSFGERSGPIRWLMQRAQGRRNDPRVPRDGLVPDSTGRGEVNPEGSGPATNNPENVGSGQWNVALNYSVARRRLSRSDLLSGNLNGGSQDLNGSISFYPTRNWAVNWRTGYSLTEGDFYAHSINIKRDLYRWQANFDVNRTPTGNTSFSFSVHLIDLPDLKADYREDSLGADRAPQPRRR